MKHSFLPAITTLLLLISFFGSCNDDEVRQLRERIEALEGGGSTESDEVMPTGIVILGTQEFELQDGCSFPLDICIVPASASIHLEDIEHSFALDLVNETATRTLGVTASKNLRIKSIEPICNAQSQIPRPGYYRLTIQDEGKAQSYDEQLSIVLSLKSKSFSEYQVCSPVIRVRAERKIFPELDYYGVPSYCLDNVKEQVEQLQKVSKNGVADMLFITDTHYKDNSLASPGILSFMAHNGLTRRVVWGGDAITAYGDIPSEWENHQRDFLGSVVPFGHYYMVRGNHEYTAKNKETGEGVTYTQEQTASLLSAYLEPDVVRPALDPEACYYYFDDPEQQLRYCVFDTTDSIVSPSLPWCTLLHTSQRQLDWMNRNALHNVPFGYQLVIITHVGITPEIYSPHAAFEQLLQLVRNAGAPVLMVISGHRHQDFQTYDQGTLHVMTGPDALYPDIKHSPFLHDLVRKSKTAAAPLMDMFSFSADRKTIYALRVGAGFSRTFHLDALTLNLSETQPLPQTTSLTSGSEITWTSYDAKGYESVDDTWDPPCTVLNVSSDGRLQPLRSGEAVLMASDNCGRKEFFNVIIR